MPKITEVESEITRAMDILRRADKAIDGNKIAMLNLISACEKILPLLPERTYDFRGEQTHKGAFEEAIKKAREAAGLL